MNKTIGIAGLGWLGLPLAQHFEFLGYKIKGTVTSIEKAKKFQQQGINAFQLQLNENEVVGAPAGFLKNLDYLIIAIPPGLRRNSGADHVAKMKGLLDEIVASSVEKIILVSSTSVYDDDQGVVTEKDIPKPQTMAGKQLLEVEQLYFTCPDLQTSIVRFGGLVGGSRQPARYIAGRKDLNGGNAPVNLIERGDCIRIISEIISQDAFGHIFNAVHPDHPSKQVYYSAKAKELGLEPPEYSVDDPSEVFKEVNSDHLDIILQYQFKNKHI